MINYHFAKIFFSFFSSFHSFRASHSMLFRVHGWSRVAYLARLVVLYDCLLWLLVHTLDRIRIFCCMQLCIVAVEGKDLGILLGLLLCLFFLCFFLILFSLNTRLTVLCSFTSVRWHPRGFRHLGLADNEHATAD